jgi:hypothetical protein
MHICHWTARAAVILSLVPAAAGAVVVTEIPVPNDTFATAQLAGGAEVTGIEGTLGDLDGDLFRFEFAMPVKVSFGNLLPDVFGDLSVQIVDLQFGSRETLLGLCEDCWYSSSGTGETVIGPISVAAGTYYLGISGDGSLGGGALGAYSLSVDATPTEGLMSPVPLPASLAGLAFGLGLLGALARRRG